MDFYPGTDFEFANLPRETQVIWLAMEGNTDKTIAQLLEITTDTVATYWKRILVRYGSSSRTEVIAEFLREYYEDDLDHLEQKVVELEEKIKTKSAAEQHQLLATAQLNSLINLLDIGVLFTNSGLKVNYVNEQLCQMAGCSLTPKELIGGDIESFLENCRIRAIKSEDSTTNRIKKLAASSQEKTIDQMTMTNGQVLERTFCNVTVRGSVIGHFIVYKNVTPYIESNQSLIQRGKLSELLVLRAIAHLDAEPEEQHGEIKKSLASISKAIGADLAIIAEVDYSRGTFGVINSWIRNEFESTCEYEQVIPLSFVDWTRKQISEREFWIIESIADLPKSASMEHSIFAEENIKSLFAVAFGDGKSGKKYFVQFSSRKAGNWSSTIPDLVMPIQKLFWSACSKQVQSKA